MASSNSRLRRAILLHRERPEPIWGVFYWTSRKQKARKRLTGRTANSRKLVSKAANRAVKGSR